MTFELFTETWVIDWGGGFRMLSSPALFYVGGCFKVSGKLSYGSGWQTNQRPSMFSGKLLPTLVVTHLLEIKFFTGTFFSVFGKISNYSCKITMLKMFNGLPGDDCNRSGERKLSCLEMRCCARGCPRLFLSSQFEFYYSAFLHFFLSLS